MTFQRWGIALDQISSEVQSQQKFSIIRGTSIIHVLQKKGKRLLKSGHDWYYYFYVNKDKDFKKNAIVFWVMQELQNEKSTPVCVPLSNSFNEV